MAKERKNDVTREQLIILLAKFIKERSKRLNENESSIEVPIWNFDWYSGCGKDKTWSNNEIKFNGNSYHFYDKEITDEDFVVIVSTALKESKCKGKVKTKEWDETRTSGWHWYEVHHKEFDSLILLGKPCKEFGTLNRLLKKYTNKEIGELEVSTANVCGKRDSWSADGHGYLEYQPTKCQKAIDFIRDKRKGKDVLSFKVVNKLVHEDEYDYQHAMYAETEWYGNEFNYLELSVTTPGGKEKGNIKVAASSKGW